MKDTREHASAAPLVSGQLLAFGPPAFSNPTVKVPSKPLVMLAFVRLEGQRSRLELSRLFWSHVAGERTKKGERKDFKSYGEARATLKRAVGVDIEDAAQLAALPCDTEAFTHALGEGRVEAALAFYRRGPLLQGVEAQARLKLSAEFLDWLDAKRAALARLAQGALLQVADNPRYKRCAVRVAEETYEAERESQNLGLLAQLYSVLSQLGSPLTFDARRRLEGRLTTLLEDEVSPESFQLYLALTLQGAPNLAAAQVATNLSPQAGAACLAELRSARLISAENTVLNPVLAGFYLEQHAKEKMALLRALAQSTPAEQAFAIFQALLEMSHTFGGVGYREKAQTAYFARASALADAGDYKAVADLLGELQNAETDSLQPPHPESRALRAFALEQLGRYKEGLATLEGILETPEVRVVKAALLTRVPDYERAKALADSVKDISIPWISALAQSTLGHVATMKKRFADAEAAHLRASTQWRLAGQPQRELSSLMNRTIVLGDSGQLEKALSASQEILSRRDLEGGLRACTQLNLATYYGRLGQEEKAYQVLQTTLEGAERDNLLENDCGLLAYIHNNLGYAMWRLGEGDAREHLERAIDLSQKIGERKLFAISLGNLALVNQDVAKLESATDLLEQLGCVQSLGFYLAHYETLLVERWLAFEEAGDFGNLLSISEKLSAHYRAHEQLSEAAPRVAEALHRVEHSVGRDHALSELRQHIST